MAIFSLSILIKLKNRTSAAHTIGIIRTKNFFVSLILILLGGLTPLLHANLNLAQKAFAEGLYDFAISQYQQILKPHDGTTTSPDKREQAEFYIVLSYYFSDKLTLAEDALENFTKSYPKSRFSLQVSDTRMRILQKQRHYEALFAEGKKSLQTFSTETNNSSVTLENFKTIVKIMLLSSETINHLTTDNARIQDLIDIIEQSQSHMRTLAQAVKQPHLASSLYGDILIIKGNLHSLKEEHKKANDFYTEALEYSLSLFPKENIKLALVKSTLALEMYDMARDILKQAIFKTKDPKLQQEFEFWLAHIPYLEGKYRRAILGYKNYIAKTPPPLNQYPYTIEAMLYLALAYAQTEQSILAVKTLNGILSQQTLIPYHYRAHELAHTLYTSLDNTPKLLVTTEELLRLAQTPEERLMALEKSILFMSATGSIPDDASDAQTLIESRIKEWLSLQSNPTLSAKLLQTAANLAYKNEFYTLSFALFTKGYTLSRERQFQFALIEGQIEQEMYTDALKNALQLEKDLLKQTSTDTASREKNIAYVRDIIGFIYLEVKQNQQAEAFYRKNRTSSDLSLRINAFFYLGEINRLEEAYQDAASLYEKAIALIEEPAATTAPGLTAKEKDAFLFKSTLQLGKIYEIGLDDMERALEYYEQAITAATKLGDMKEQSKLHLTRGRLYLSLNQATNSLQELRKISATDEENYYRALLLMASIEFNRARYTPALSYYIRIINDEDKTENPPPPDVLVQAYYERILVKLKTRSPSEAYYYLGKMELRFPESLLFEEAYTSIADFFFMVNELPSAIKVSLEGAKQAQLRKNIPWQIRSLFDAARFELRLNKKDSRDLAYSRLHSAIELSETIQWLTPTYLEAYFEAAIINAEKQNLKLAHEQFSKILQYESTISAAYPTSAPLITSLAIQAKENNERIQAFTQGSPYSAAKTIAEIKQKMQQLQSPQLKAEGAVRIIRLHNEQNESKEALAFLEYASKLWPIPNGIVIEVLQALITQKKYNQVYTTSLQYFLTEDFQDDETYLEFLYYAAALSAAKTSHNLDSTRFKEKLKNKFPYSIYLQELP